MPDKEPSLRPATKDEVEQTLAFALRFRGRKRDHTATEFTAQIAAAHLVEHLRISGFVVMKTPPSQPHGPVHYPVNPHLTE